MMREAITSSAWLLDVMVGAILGVVIGSAVLYVIGWILNFVGWTVLHDLGEGTKIFSLFF